MDQHALTLQGHTCTWASNATVAIEQAAKKPFDLLITNLVLADMRAWDLIEELDARDDLPLYIITMNALSCDPSVPTQDLQPLVDAGLLKPCEFLDLKILRTQPGQAPPTNE